MRPAVPSDLPALKALWSLSFPEDGDAARDAFFAAVGITHCFVEEKDGVVASMTFGLPVSDGEREFQYIYAACTHPDFRGRGVFSELLQQVLAQAKARGFAASFLHPAEPSLAAFYARFGYTPAVFVSRGQGEAKRPVPVEKLTAEDYAARRERLAPAPYLRWPTAQLALVSERYAVEDSVALCERRGETLVVKEWLGGGDPSGLAAALGCTRYEWVRPAEDGEAYVLWLPFDEHCRLPYVGPVFD